MRTVTINGTTIPPETISQLFTVALEHTADKWCDGFILTKGVSVDTPVMPVWRDPRLFAEDFRWLFYADGTENSVDRDDVVCALTQMCVHPSWELMYERICQQQIDTKTADVFLQLCVFGELVYANYF